MSKKRILIVGGVAGGASFAARMRRLDENAEIIMFEKGEFISFANCGLPYYIGNTIEDRKELLIQTPKKFNARFNVDVRTMTEVIGVDSKNKTVTVRNNLKESIEKYDVLLLSPGSTPAKPPITGLDNPAIFTVKTIPDSDAIKAYAEKPETKHALVVGGGFIGLEIAENLRLKGLNVTLVEFLDQVFPPMDREMAETLHQHLTLNGIELILGKSVTRFEENSASLIAVLSDGKTVATDMVIMAAGVKADTGFLTTSGIALTERGAIIVDDHMATNAADVYAVGDAVEVTEIISGKKVVLPMAGPANRQARIAADNASGIPSTYAGAQGTAICKVFDLAGAVTGMNEKTAKRLSIPYAKSYTHSLSHAGYYPGAFPLSIKIIFDPKSGKILGAQAVGRDGVDKRIDVIATAIRQNLTVHDLTELELSYAPPYGSARDPVNIAGLVAENIVTNRMPVFYAEEVAALDPAKTTILDVRTKTENEAGEIPGTTLIPVDALRSRLSELDKTKPIAVYCQVGLRGYLATRILNASGFSAKNLSGGYKTWQSVKGNIPDMTFNKPSTEPVCSSPSAGPGKEHLFVNASGLQCPGPIMKLKEAIDSIKTGETIQIKATDQGFAADIPAWCHRTKNTLVTLANDHGTFCAVIKKGAATDVCRVAADDDSSRRKTMVIFSNDMDKMLAAFIISNGAAAMGSEVTLFFTFWGLNILRKDSKVKVPKGMVEKMFGIMMPRGPKKTVLSKMHMMGMGTAMMQWVMRKKNVYSLSFLIEQAQKAGIRFVACTMSMDIMGIKKEELIDGIEFGGVSYYLEKADSASYNLFI